MWQEGHTAHATREEAVTEVFARLEDYATTYEDLLAVPVMRGIKSKKETFAGADFTSTVELFVPTNGRGIQGATSHLLGQHFSRKEMFNINFQNKEGKKDYAWQTSWGFTTRSIGSMIMIHGDNKGLVLPPRVAQIQAVIVPIVTKQNTEQIMNKADELAEGLKAAGVRVKVDHREHHKPGFKYAYWELKGVPLRIELGARDMEETNKCVIVARRENGEKTKVSWSDLNDYVVKELDQIHTDMLEKARTERDGRIANAENWTDFMAELNKK